MKKVDLWFLFIDKFRCQRATLEKFITKNSDATKKGKSFPKMFSKYLMCGFSFCWLFLLQFLALFFVLFFQILACLLGGVEMPTLLFCYFPSLFSIVFAAFVLFFFFYAFLFWIGEKWGGKTSAIKIKRRFEPFDWLTASFENVGQVSTKSDNASNYCSDW